jgi:hydroxymethylpyrimidine/phosphomethylpyrimidine kinase
MASDVSRILIIAGSDSGGGAGIQADIKTVSALGGHAMTAITAVTAQNSRGVNAVHAAPTDMVIAQIDAVLDDFGADAVKIGMIGSPVTARAVADRLSQVGRIPIVFDPVMVATSGAQLADDETVAAFGSLMALATIVTPNLAEARALGGVGVMATKARAILLKGGHEDQAVLTDRLFIDGAEVAHWSDPRIDTPHMHGTGCTLASAIAGGLGEGRDLQEAIARARRFVRLALERAPDLVENNGPMGQQFVSADEL